jgi:hypothetical protein
MAARRRSGAARDGRESDGDALHGPEQCGDDGPRGQQHCQADCTERDHPAESVDHGDSSVTAEVEEVRGAGRHDPLRPGKIGVPSPLSGVNEP